mmetsp:Transcript_123244/g.359853  ORF Transcript_123244/g.359853 Transcript_123244/m.359853 type:complete len:212 (+) Transcript_123244:2014-2649(+)
MHGFHAGGRARALGGQEGSRDGVADAAEGEAHLVRRQRPRLVAEDIVHLSKLLNDRGVSRFSADPVVGHERVSLNLELTYDQVHDFEHDVQGHRQHGIEDDHILHEDLEDVLVSLLLRQGRAYPAGDRKGESHREDEDQDADDTLVQELLQLRRLGRGLRRVLADLSLAADVASHAEHPAGVLQLAAPEREVPDADPAGPAADGHGAVHVQ